MKRRILIVLVALVIIVSLALGFRANRHYLTRYPRVQAAMVMRGDLVEDIEVSGRILAEEVRDLYPTMEVKVESVFVKDGDHINVGQPILEYESDDIKLQLAQCNVEVLQVTQELERLKEQGVPTEVVAAQARLDQAKLALDLAKSDFKKKDGLYVEGVITKSDYELSKNQLDSASLHLEHAQEELRLAKANKVDEKIASLEANLRVLRLRAQLLTKHMNDLVLKSPINGRISIIHLKPGERADFDFRVAQVIDENSIEIEAEVPAEDAPKVQIGDQAEISFGTIADPYPAEVIKILPPIRNQDGYGNVRVRLRPLKSKEEMIPGTPVRVRIRFGRSKLAVSVPIESIHEERKVVRGDEEYFSIRPGTGKKQYYVFVLKDCSETMDSTKERERRWIIRDNIYEARKVYVETGISNVDRVEVANGLSPFEQVVINSDREIVDYDRVIVLSRDERYKNPIKSGSGD